MKLISEITNTSDIEDIVDIFKNEISITNDAAVELLYERLLCDCFLQLNGFITYDIISEIRKTVSKSNSKVESINQYKRLIDPKNEFSAILLKIFTQYPNKKVISSQKNLNIDFISALSKISSFILTGKKISNYYINTILRSKI